MENFDRIDPTEPEPILERDVVALLAMLDYLIAEVAPVDAMSAQCLMLARKSLLEVVATALVRAH